MFQADAFAIGAVGGVARGVQGVADHAAAQRSGGEGRGLAENAGIDIILEALVAQL
ncbi:hypothetical protein D3C72_2566300 [compost metagenome]